MVKKTKQGIYRIVNIENRNMYVGQSVDLKKRRRDHLSGLRNGNHKNKHLQNSWNKYGEDAFYFQPIEECSGDILTEREQHWYDFYKDKGFTMYNYGEFVDNPFRGRSHSGETRRKIGEANKGRTVSEETRRKLSEINKGSNHPMYGKTLSEETRRKMSEAKKNMSEETRRKIGEARRGKTASEETRRKLSEAKRNMSEETRRKMGEAHRKISDEQIYEIITLRKQGKLLREIASIYGVSLGTIGNYLDKTSERQRKTNQ